MCQNLKMVFSLSYIWKGKIHSFKTFLLIPTFRMLYVRLRQKLSVAKPSQLQIQLLVWGCIEFLVYLQICMRHFIFLFSPCSGIIVSGYSKTSTDKSLITHLAKDIIAYQKFKQMYKVDTSGDFKGLTLTANNVPN